MERICFVLLVFVFIWVLFATPNPMAKQVVNHFLEAYLCCFAHEKPKSWYQYLAWAEYSFNTGYHPFVPGGTKLADLEVKLLAHNQMLNLLQSNLLKVQSHVKSQADSKRHELSFNVGDVVLLCLQPYRQKSGQAS